jgi:F0F1-type ATP synthase assembly protein I
MDESNRKEDRSTWAIGGGVLIGIGAGFFFLRTSPLAFVGCILLGIGLGLMVTSLLSCKKGSR